jgi:hypothetical protein
VNQKRKKREMRFGSVSGRSAEVPGKHIPKEIHDLFHKLICTAGHTRISLTGSRNGDGLVRSVPVPYRLTIMIDACLGTQILSLFPKHRPGKREFTHLDG